MRLLTNTWLYGFWVGLLLMIGIVPCFGADSLAVQVVTLHVGIQGYELGRPLNEQQWQQGREHQEQRSYAGTVKFRDGDLYVIVSEKEHTVLAMYHRLEKGTRQDLKAMVATLLDHFGEPTTMAHDKMIYWAYNKNGLINEETFTKAKQAGAVANLGILATVKLHSTMEITAPSQPDSKTMQSEKMKAATGKKASDRVEKQGTLYYLITSEPLLQEFIRKQKKDDQGRKPAS